MKRITSFLQLDSHTLLTLTFRLWSVVAGIVNLVMVPLHLGSVEQGYYYTFGGIIALQVFFELGLGQVLTQFTSHEIAHLDLTDRSRYSISPHYERLASLVQAMGRWYKILAVAFGIVVGVVGLYFFRKNGNLPMQDWAPAWAMLLVSSSINLWMSPRLAFLEGCGRIADVARMRVVQSLMGYALMWTVLLLHGGLNAAPAVPVIAAFYSFFWLRRNAIFLTEIEALPKPTQHRIEWRKEILPLQWRISVSWISSYLIFNLFTPVVFARVGETEAGKVGMSMAVFGSITSIGMSWINAKAPQLSIFAATRRFVEMKALFWRSMLRSAGAIAIAALGFLLLADQLKLYIPRVGTRLLPAEALWYLAAVALANGVIFSAATYMRSFKREPMLAVSVTTGIISCAAIYAGSNVNTMRMIELYSCVIVLICLPWTGMIFREFYRKYR